MKTFLRLAMSGKNRIRFFPRSRRVSSGCTGSIASAEDDLGHRRATAGAHLALLPVLSRGLYFECVRALKL
jgi:hypothetical protein